VGHTRHIATVASLLLAAHTHKHMRHISSRHHTSGGQAVASQRYQQSRANNCSTPAVACASRARQSSQPEHSAACFTVDDTLLVLLLLSLRSLLAATKYSAIIYTQIRCTSEWSQYYRPRLLNSGGTQTASLRCKLNDNVSFRCPTSMREEFRESY
jgi:hypothetical protein